MTNADRRYFLKVVVFGGGGLLLAKFLGPFLTRLIDGPSVEHDFESFKSVENKKTLTIFDNTGAEIFQIDKGQ